MLNSKATCKVILWLILLVVTVASVSVTFSIKLIILRIGGKIFYCISVNRL